MVLYFITGNKGKLNEMKEIINGCEQLDINLVEIQELDAKKIIEAKLNEALKQKTGSFFCEDTSVYINCLNGFPGPLIKWYAQALGNDGIYKQVKHFKDKSAYAKAIIGYTNGEEIQFFEGIIEGEIVAPRGDNGFGWDKIFMPKGYNKTFGEMSVEEKNKISMRKIAAKKLKEYLN